MEIASSIGQIAYILESIATTIDYDDLFSLITNTPSLSNSVISASLLAYLYLTDSNRYQPPLADDPHKELRQALQTVLHYNDNNDDEYKKVIRSVLDYFFTNHGPESE